jgi:hypothetical protein
LEKIENKVDKETKSSRSISRKSHDEKIREERSVGKNYFKKECNISSPYPIRKHNRRTRVDKIQGEMNKIKPPTLYGEKKNNEDAETWLLDMRKYFQLHNYSTHVEGRITIYQLKGKESMWWDQYFQVQHIDEKKATWREFKRYFQNKHLTKQYHGRKMKDLFELKLWSMTIDEYERIFLERLKYVPFIKDEQVNIQRYMSGIPSFIIDNI